MGVLDPRWEPFLATTPCARRVSIPPPVLLQAGPLNPPVPLFVTYHSLETDVGCTKCRNFYFLILLLEISSHTRY
jgi:hypothetical protein